MPKKMRPKPEPKEPPAMGLIICHIDELKLQIESTDKNCDKLAENFTGFLEDLNLRFTGHKKLPRQEFHGKKRQHQKCVYNCRSKVSQIKILFHSWLTPFLKQNSRIPNAVELRELRANGFKIRFLAKVEMTNIKKRDYIEHTENIYRAVNLLTQLEMSISKLEIAMDTGDKIAGEFIRKYTCLKKGPSYDQVFHCIGKSKKKIEGPSADSNNEYHGYRARGRKPEPGRRVGGRKQVFSYIREIDENNTSIQRVELRLYREVARKLRARYGPSILEVVNNIENILRDCIWFQKLELVKMHSKKPLINILSPKDLSTKGQRCELLKAGYRNTFIKKYVETFLWPQISFPPYR